MAVAASEAAFREFVASSSPVLLRAAWLLTGEEALAQDLVQAAFERTWTRRARVTQTDEPLAYVRKVMTSIFLTWRRRRWWAEIPSSSPWRIGPVIDDADGALVRRCVVAALTQLSPRQRAVVVLRYFADLSEAQTAAALGCSPGTENAHAARSLTQLRSTPELHGLGERRRSMSGDEQELRELLQRAAPDLGQLHPPAAMGRVFRPRPVRLVAVIGAVIAVVTVAMVVSLSRPDHPGHNAAPAVRPSPGHTEGTSALRRLVNHTPCPPPKHTALASRAQLAAFPAVAAVTCTDAERTYPHDGEWSVLIKKASATGIEQLKEAFEQPDMPAPRGGVACADVLIVGAPVLFVDSAGRYLVPRYPIDHTCGYPRALTLRAVEHQPWKAISTTRLQQERTPAELATGCANRIKNVVAIDVQLGIDRSPGGPVFTYHPHASLTACIYHRSASDPEVGNFVRGVRLNADQSAQLRAALTGPGPISQTCQPQDTFAAISTRGGDTVYLELGGCWRLERDEPHVTIGTADPAAVNRLLHL